VNLSEAREKAVILEIKEELGIDTLIDLFLVSVCFDYGFKQTEPFLFVCKPMRGTP
jgi:hypothetical protein